MQNRSGTDNSSIPYIVEGVVQDVDDPNQMGRLKIWCPSVDGDQAVTESLPWAEYASPFAGTVTDFKRGANNSITGGPTAYGFWALPKLNAHVLVFFLNGDANRRFYFSSIFSLHANRGLPAGRNTNSSTGENGIFSDSGEPIQPITNNMKEAFGGSLNSPQAKSRGAYQRQVAQSKTYKDGTEGYAPNAMDDTSFDSQSYCFVTPGGNALIFSDTDKHCRATLKTPSGNRLIFDDTNERIYVATAKGKSWFEMDEDGHVSAYGAESISFRTDKDFNISAGGDINLDATGSINLKAAKDVKASGTSIHLNASGSVFATAGAKAEIKGGAGIVATGAKIHLNGPSATSADAASGVSISPSHEPWSRPPTTATRNPNWSE